MYVQIICTSTSLHTHVPVLIYPEMTHHFLDQAKYPIYQQHPIIQDAS